MGKIEEEKTWDVTVVQTNIFQVDAVDETEARRQAEFDCIWDERCGNYKYEIEVKEISDEVDLKADRLEDC